VDPYSDFNEYIDLAKEEELSIVISNTTEAGIEYIASDKLEMQPPSSFPAKLTLLLYERYKHFEGDSNKGLTIIPCELINYNSDTLKEIILKYIELWQLDKEFKNWILDHNSFHNTLVDRIVPGYPKDQIEDYNKQLDYIDNLIVSAETFFLWVIEGDEILKEKLQFHKTDLNVRIVGDMQPFRTRKVRILNGAHTAMVPFSILFGNTTVKETIDDGFTGDFIYKAVFEEIVDTLKMEKAELINFGEEIFDRFRNPFIKHKLSSIALNSVSKFKVRVLPSLLEYIKIHQEIPIHLTYAFACLIRFYKGTWHGKKLPVNDSIAILDTFSKIWKMSNYGLITNAALENINYWGVDLTKIEILSDAIEIALEEIDSNGIEMGFVNYKNRIVKF
jgi:tagaturonate reductase